MSDTFKRRDHLVAHPAADLFPPIEGTEFDELVADVAAYGVREPIVLYDGKILDGRNRYRAANAAGVVCPSRQYEADDAVGFVISANLRRRHLKESQRAMIADTLANLPRGANQHASIEATSQTVAAKALDVARSQVQRARKVRLADAGVAALVVAGKINLHEAGKLIALPKIARPVAVTRVQGGDDIRTAIRAAKKRDYTQRIESAKPKTLEGTYRIIYADPPWKYHGLNNADEYGHAEAHYDCLDDDQLIAFRPDGERLVKDLADDNAVLFMWVTAPLLERCFPIINAWGFKYKGFFVWDKVHHNMGFYNSVRAELLLICTRGSCLPDTGKLIDSVQTIDRSGKHSEKPREFYEIIDSMYDHGRKLELFARCHRVNWDCAGNERPNNFAVHEIERCADAETKAAA